MNRSKLAGSLLASVLVLACEGAVQAEQMATTSDAASAGMRVFKDPVTGQFREPTAAEVKALNRAAQKDKAKRDREIAKSNVKGKTSQLTARKLDLADGTVGMEVPESEYNYVVVTRAADGSLRQACAQGEDAALHASHSPVIAQETVYETQ